MYYDPQAMLGRRIRNGRFVIDRILGEGQSGVVYAIRDEQDGREYAAKLLRDGELDRATLRRFEKEAKIALDHPNIVRVYPRLSGWTREGVPYIVSELVVGRNLHHLRCEEGCLAVARALGICREVACGLSVAHAADIIHRDLKPENIVIADADGAAKILDFGIAKKLDESTALTEPGVLVGTLGFVAPEQPGSVDARSDIFALGAILYELMTGHGAFSGRDTREILIRTREARPTDPSDLNPSVTPPVAALVQRMLARLPANRYPNCDELIAAIDDVLAGLAPAQGSEVDGG